MCRWVSSYFPLTVRYSCQNNQAITSYPDAIVQSSTLLLRSPNFTMSTPTTREVLRLYRDLLRYGKQLKFTDVEYYTRRIRTEFHKNKTLESAEDIQFNFKVSFIFNLNRLISV